MNRNGRDLGEALLNWWGSGCDHASRGCIEFGTGGGV